MKTYGFLSVDELRVVATGSGCELYLAEDHELLLDLDDDAQLNMNVWELIVEHLEAKVKYEWRSRGGGRHVVIELNTNIHPMAQVALQAALGSDPVRETLAALEYVHREATNTMERTNSLFKPKEVPDADR